MSIYNKIAIIFFLFINITNAQVIEKVVDFEYATPKNMIPKKSEFGLSESQNRPFLLNMEILNDSIKVNSFLPIAGNLYENGKKSYEFSGGFNLITSNFFNSKLENLGQKENVFVNFNGKPAVKYEFREPIDRKNFNIYGVESTNKFYLENTSIIDEDNTYPYQIIQKGGGMLKTKNAFLQINKFNYGVAATGFGKIVVNGTWDLVHQQDWENKTKDLSTNNEIKANFIITNNLYTTLVNRIDPDDRNWPNKKFNFIIFDSKGKINNTNQIDFEYIRKFNQGDKVYDEQGNIQGFILSFKSDDQLAGKKLKDPIGNKINLFYFNLKGELVFKVDLIHGNKDDYFNPSIVIIKNNQLHIINKYRDFSVTNNKEYVEKLIIDKTGKVSSENLYSKIKVSKGVVPNDFSLDSPIFYNGSIYANETKFTETFEGVRTYQKSIVSKMKIDFTEAEVTEVFNKGPQKDYIWSNLVVSESGLFSVICYADGNQVMKVNSLEKPLEISYKDSFQPLSQNLLKNFVVGKDKKSIYFVQEKAKSGLGKIIKVAL